MGHTKVRKEPIWIMMTTSWRYYIPTQCHDIILYLTFNIMIIFKHFFSLILYWQHMTDTEPLHEKFHFRWLDSSFLQTFVLKTPNVNTCLMMFYCIYSFTFLTYTPTFPVSTADFVHLVGKPSTTFDKWRSSISEERANWENARWLVRT
jgi:hypothetical protein